MIAIIGGGITGLYLGKLLLDKGIEFKLFEARETAGGNIGTFSDGPYLLEQGPNSLRMNEAFHHLVKDLGLENALQFTAPAARKRFVLKDGRYRPIPLGPISLLFGSFFGFKTVRRILKERRIPSREIQGETVDAFFRRRFGDGVSDYLVAPFISGIYAGDSKALLLKESFPVIHKWEQEYGSVLRGFFKGREKSAYKGIFSFEKGLGQMTAAIEKYLGDHLATHSPLKSLQKEEQYWKLEFENGQLQADQVVLAMPAYASANLLAPWDVQAATDLRKVNYAAVSVVHSAYSRASVQHPLDGFGCLHNHLEPSHTLGTIFSSTTFPNRCPADQALLTTFVGGARHPARAAQSDEALLKSVQADFKHFLGISAPPLFTRITRWEKGIPQYDTDILPARTHLDRLSQQGLHLAGNWTHGISVPSSMEKAQKLCEQLSHSPKGNLVS